MMEFKDYKRKAIAQARPVFIEEFGEVAIVEAKGISISKEDKLAGSPKEGDMVGRNPKNYKDQWLIAAAYFKENFEEI